MEIVICSDSQLSNQILELLKSFHEKDIYMKDIDYFNSKQKLNPCDHITFLNISTKLDNDIIIANKIKTENIPYYPDMIIETKIPAGEIIDNDEKIKMVINFAKKNICPHQISFISIANSDNETFSLNKAQYILLDDFLNSSIKFFKKQKSVQLDEKLNIYSAMFKCSVSMQNRLKQQLLYASINDVKIENFINLLKDEGKIPVKSKKDSVTILNELDKYLITNSKI